MTFTISKKLVLAFLGLTLVVLIATLGLARWSFERGFLDYVNALEQGRLESVSVSLAREYVRKKRDWSRLTERRFSALLREFRPEASEFEGMGPSRPPPMGMGYPPPPRGGKGSDEVRGPGRGFPPPPRNSRLAATEAPFDNPSELGPPTALFDVDGNHVAGVPAEHIVGDYIAVSVIVDEEVVGELRSAPRRHFESPQETAFSQQQWVTSGVTAVVALALAVGVSLFLTKILLAPIRRMMFGVSQLSSGDYGSRLNEHRDDELGQLMNDLDKLALSLEENRSSRQRWLADISHELRTPVTVLTGEIEIMKDGIRPLDMEQVLSLDQEVTRLRRLIEDLYELSLSDIGGLRYSFTVLDVREILDLAVTSIQKRALDRGIVVSVDDEGQGLVNGDPQRLEQLMVNLLENSLAYTDAPGRIDITLGQQDARALIVIEDTPPGVSQEDCLKLFDPLYRQDSSRNRRKAGAGLGLAICRNIVVAHQGSIVATPAATGGLRVEIVLPLANGHGHE